MKQLITLFLLLSVTLVKAQGTTHYDKLFAEGNMFYEQNEYEQALTKYKEVVQANYASPELYYNMANAYFKVEQVPQAILYYEKALKLSPDDKDIQYNLNVAYGQITDKVNQLPPTIFSKAWASMLNTFSSNAWAWISIVIFMLAITSLILYVLLNGVALKKGFFLGAGILFSFFLVVFIFAWQQKKLASSANFGVVFSASLNVKSAPKESASTSFVIHEGLKVEVLEEHNSWLRIALSDGNTGWVSVNAIERI